MVTKLLIRKTIYPRPHVMENKFEMSLNGTTKATTLFPIIQNDEGLGDPASYNSHPEHASFAEYVGPNCYPESHVNKTFTKFTVTMSKLAIETDKLRNLLVCFIPIYMAFKEDYTAIDEVTSIETQDVLELVTESTDRQATPIWNGQKLGGDFPTLGADVVGLTTDTKIEGIAFDLNQYIDSKNHLTIAGKMRKIAGQTIWKRVSRDRPATFKMRTINNSKVKMINPYTFCGVIIHMPLATSIMQLTMAADDTNITHTFVTALCRYNEWNENFDHTKT